jgi:hypothetical protein
MIITTATTIEDNTTSVVTCHQNRYLRKVKEKTSNIQGFSITKKLDMLLYLLC